MGKKFHVQKMLTEGSKVNRDVEHDDIYQKAKVIADKMPSGNERIIYIRNLVSQTKSGKVDMDVFKMVIKMTNSWMEVETMK